MSLEFLICHFWHSATLFKPTTFDRYRSCAPPRLDYCCPRVFSLSMRYSYRTGGTPALQPPPSRTPSQVVALSSRFSMTTSWGGLILPFPPACLIRPLLKSSESICLCNQTAGFGQRSRSISPQLPLGLRVSGNLSDLTPCPRAILARPSPLTNFTRDPRDKFITKMHLRRGITSTPTLQRTLARLRLGGFLR